MISRLPVAAVCFLIGLAVTSCSAGDPALGREALADLTPIEADALADKFVDENEANLATEALKECLTAAGFTIHHYRPAGSDQNPGDIGYGYTGSVDDPMADDLVMDAKAEACHSEVNAISAVWVLQNESFNNWALPGLAEALQDLEIDGR